MILTYERTWIRINETMSGRVNWTSTDIVNNGTSSYPVTLSNVVLGTPSFQLLNCNFQANDTEVDLLLIGGNSGLDVRNVTMTLMYLIEDLWASVSDSKIDILRCRNGDFNVKVEDSEIGTLETMMTTGFNLKVTGSSLDDLSLMYAHPEAPNNVEVLDTNIGSLYLTPSSPPAYLFEGVEVADRLVLEAGDGVVQPPLLTGSLTFGANCTVDYDEREGVTELIRVYRVEVHNMTDSEMPYTLVNGNKTIKTGTVGESGVIVFPLKFRREYILIPDPQPGGPYFLETNNFTSPLVLTIGDHPIPLKLTSDTPIEFNIISEAETVITPQPTSATSIGLLTVLALAALILIGSRAMKVR